MDVLKSTNKQKMYISSLMTPLIFGMIIFSGYIISLSSKLSSSTGNVNAKIGPFILFELYKKTSQNSGYTAGINIKSGILVYCSFWMAVGIIIMVTRLMRQKLHE